MWNKGECVISSTNTTNNAKARGNEPNEPLENWSIFLFHSFSLNYPGRGRSGSRQSNVTQASFSPATLWFFLGDPKCSQAKPGI